MRPWTFDIGRKVTVRSMHCEKCQFNVTPEGRLQKAIARWRERDQKRVKIVAVGEGLGVRFPKEFVEEYAITKGTKVLLKPEQKGIKVELVG